MRGVAGMVIGIVALAVFIQPALADDLKVSIDSVAATVHYGDQITLAVQTEPKASCEGTSLGRTTKGNYPLSGHLRQQTANNEGKVTWTWNAPKQPSKLDINITCTAGDRSGKASATVTVL